MKVSNIPSSRFKFAFSLLIVAAGITYYFSNPKPQYYYDYTFRVASNILQGGIGIAEEPPIWLNEFVPYDGLFYSVFPLGSVITMVPFAFLKMSGLVKSMPAAFLVALSAGLILKFLLLISKRYELTYQRRILMTLGILFGTWMWTNLTLAGSWQLALGFAMLGELGAVYFTVYDRRPMLAGLFFALAFGNRTEILLTAPIFFYLPMREDFHHRDAETQSSRVSEPRAVATGFFHSIFRNPQSAFRFLTAFCVFPFILGVATLAYNYIRFDSFTDFGYARIPGVLDEPWYYHGIFSIYYITGQIWEMLLRPWEFRSVFPYIVPDGFSSSILLSSPFLLFAFRLGARDKLLKYAAWLAIFLLTCLLWTHGNSGGWQFGYRYAMVLLPWLFVILLETAPKKITRLEWAAYIFSFAANAYATWLFHWTNYVKQ
ncbi:MAG: hypothetical protein ACR2M8_02590 [Pyrinomonadaceae bacterium]